VVKENEHRGGRGWQNRRFEALRYKIEHGVDLFARDVELLHDFLDAQISQISMTVATGRRVSLNTHAPLTLPGMLSTARHWEPWKKLR
jgi:hypothetical protein